MSARERIQKQKNCWFRYASGMVWLTFGILASQTVTAQNAPEADEPPAEEPAPESAAGSEAVPYTPEPLPQTLTLAAGTVISVRTTQYLSSDQNRAGDGFSAELEQPLVVDGWVVARRGQTVLGRVVTARKAGRVKGVSQLAVEVTHLVFVDGRQVPVRTEFMQNTGGTSQGRDAHGVGAAASTGAVVGAIADGGKGAGIGAAVGAGAGLAGVLLTRGRATEIPPETLLTFQLEAPVTISTERSRVAFRSVSQEDYDGGRGFRRRSDRFAHPRDGRPTLYPYPYPFYPGQLFLGYFHIGGRRHHRHW